MQLAGVLVTIDHRGLLDVAHGLVAARMQNTSTRSGRSARIEADRRQREREAELQARSQGAKVDGSSYAATDEEALAQTDQQDHGDENGAAVPEEEDDAIASTDGDGIDLEELKASVDSGESDPLHLAMALNGELSHHLTWRCASNDPAARHRAAASRLCLRALASVRGLSASLSIDGSEDRFSLCAEGSGGTEAAAVFAEEREVCAQSHARELLDPLRLDHGNRPQCDRPDHRGRFFRDITAHVGDKSPFSTKIARTRHRLMQVLDLDMGRWWQADEAFFKRAGKR